MTIVVVCVAASATELIARARAIAQAARVISLCTEADGDNHAYIACGADEIVCIPYRDDPCAQGTLIAEALKKLKPDAALFPATVHGRFLSAWAAAKLQTGLTADCTGLSL
ncbi:MAG: hypothetical protein PHY64_14645, partial [Eubacteriales bacterium]|nr:hypothetical protein [Eubacteriales bacterium]